MGGVASDQCKVGGSQTVLRIEGVTEDEIDDYDNDYIESLNDSGHQDGDSSEENAGSDTEIVSKRRRTLSNISVAQNTVAAEPDNECINSFLDKCTDDVRKSIYKIF